MRMVALDPFLNPTHMEENNMVHLQFAKEYRSMLMALKKSGFLKHESIPIKDTYTACMTSPTEPSGKNWSLRVIAGTMTIKCGHDGKLMLSQQNIELNDYVTDLRINHRSPTLDTVYKHIRRLNTYAIEMGKTATLDAKRNKLRYGNRQTFGNITRSKQELSL